MKLSFKLKSIIIGGFLVSSIIGASALEIYLDYLDTEQRAYKASSDVTLVVERQIQDTVISVDNIIETNAKLISEEGSLNSVKSKKFWAELRSTCVSLTGCEAIAISEPSGKLILDTSIEVSKHNVSGREFFQEAVRTKKLFISPAIISRLPNNPSIFVISRPVYNKKKELLAVIIVGMKTSHLTGFYSLLGFGFSPTVSVFKGNGDLVSRNPGMEEHIGKNNSQSQIFTELLPKAPEGTYLSKSKLDGLERLAAYKSVPKLDLIIFAGVETPVAFMQWKIRAFRMIATIGVLLIFTLTAFYFAYTSMLEAASLQRKNEKLDELSNVDELTGIGNRRIFETTLKQEWSRYKRYKVDMAVLLIDVDYFKPYNDNYGHQEGDKTLHKVAQALQDCIRRPTDLVARYGGEEFVVILNADESGAILMAEVIRKKIESLAITHEFSQVNKVITVSIGVASSNSTTAKTPEALVHEADISLYKAKHAGRNRISVFNPNDNIETMF
jgi:diguanylate cyclase (GGDEF)-like protein